MGFTAYRYYKQCRFKTNQISTCFKKLISELKLGPEGFYITGEYRIDDNTKESKNLSISDIGTLCEIKDRPEGLSFHFSPHNEKYAHSDIVFFQAFRGLLQLGQSLSGPKNSDVIFEIIEDSLQLVRTELSEHKEMEIIAIEERLRALEDHQNQDKQQLSCFLSYRFNSRSKALALELTRFLDLLGVKVITGAGYEPRRLDEKVITRLEQPLDFFIYLIIMDGESTWTRDELAYSLAKGYAVVLLVESGSQIEKGLLGDWEYIEFEGDHIGDSFIGILEALQYIKREKMAPKR